MDRHALGDSFGQDTFAVQASAIIGHFNTNIPTLVLGGKRQIADWAFAGFKAFFRQFDTMVEAVTHQVRQRIDDAFNQALIEFG